MERDDGYSDDFGCYSSLASDRHTKRFYSSASLEYVKDEYAGYSFIAVLGLAQRLHVDFLPITWDEDLRPVGRGGQARINQVMMNIQTSFAFKSFDHQRLEDPFREIVQEITVLAHPSIRQHPYINRLEGICWDITENDEVWPVLVFQKTHLSDLYDFATSERGIKLSAQDRLELCADIGVAIRDMHANNIIHGDIKPSNILIFQENSEKYRAKVADFGWSTWFRRVEIPISMPRSVPWNAPEHQWQKFHLAEAKRMDVYSFGMLCLWLLFGVESSATTPSLRALNASEFLGFNTTDENLLHSWKHDENDRLLEWAVWVVANHGCFETEREDDLIKFFRSCLRFDQSVRNTDWNYLLSLLDQARELPSTEILSEGRTHEAEYFEIAPSVWSLYTSDFRLRSFITKSLEAIALNSAIPTFQHTSTAKAVEQLAVCYKIGFGIPRDEWEWRKAPIDHSQSAIIEEQLRSIRFNKPTISNTNGLFCELHKQGFPRYISARDYCHKKGLLARARKVYEGEIQATKKVFGEDHWLNLKLRIKIVGVLRCRGEWKEAEGLVVRIIEMWKRRYKEGHLNAFRAMGILASIYRDQGRLKEAEELYLQLLDKLKEVRMEHQETLAVMFELAVTYGSQGRWEDAETLSMQVFEADMRMLGAEHPSTLFHMRYLAEVFRNQSRLLKVEEMEEQILKARTTAYGEENSDTLSSMDSLRDTYLTRKGGGLKKAEELEMQWIEKSTGVIGGEHPNTLDRRRNLAAIYWLQGQWTKAKEQEVEVLEIRKKVLGEEHCDTVDSMVGAAIMYECGNQWKEAEKLEVQVVEIRKGLLGEEHPDTLTSMVRLSTTYQNRALYKEAEELGLQVLGIRKRVLGEEHPDTIDSIHRLAEFYREQGRKQEAEDFQIQAMDARRRPLMEQARRNKLMMPKQPTRFERGLRHLISPDSWVPQRWKAPGSNQVCP